MTSTPATDRSAPAAPTATPPVFAELSPPYSTIVADPPWDIGAFPANLHTQGQGVKPMPYSSMTTEDIEALPVRSLAAPDAHLYLWTTNQFLEPSYAIARAWGFRPVKVLVWCKAPKGRGLGGTFASATEYVLFARRGSLNSTGRVDRNWWQWARGAHSAKPAAFLDIVEQVSPGPYVELFARAPRLGWDSWGKGYEGVVA
jgi:N6-adenosine-specific RNA methylase IME4